MSKNKEFSLGIHPKQLLTKLMRVNQFEDGASEHRQRKRLAECVSECEKLLQISSEQDDELLLDSYYQKLFAPSPTLSRLNKEAVQLQQSLRKSLLKKKLKMIPPQAKYLFKHWEDAVENSVLKKSQAHIRQLEELLKKQKSEWQKQVSDSKSFHTNLYNKVVSFFIAAKVKKKQVHLSSLKKHLRSLEIHYRQLKEASEELLRQATAVLNFPSELQKNHSNLRGLLQYRYELELQKHIEFNLSQQNHKNSKLRSHHRYLQETEENKKAMLNKAKENSKYVYRHIDQRGFYPKDFLYSSLMNILYEAYYPAQQRLQELQNTLNTYEAQESQLSLEVSQLTEVFYENFSSHLGKDKHKDMPNAQGVGETLQ